MSIAHVIAIAYIVTVIVGHCDLGNSDTETAIRYLQKYGFLNNSTESVSFKDAKHALRSGLALLQEYYRLPGRGELNDATLDLMRKPRCGLPDIPDHSLTNSLSNTWPRKHLKWNFYQASKKTLEVTHFAFNLWAASSPLTFERSAHSPDIVISFREGLHVNQDLRNGDMCPWTLDGPGGVLAHATFPTGKRDHIGEVHLDKAEPWHIHINANPSEKISLLYVLTHEIGHALGLHHSENKDSIMYALAPQIPVHLTVLSPEDIASVRRLYDTENETDYPKPTATTTTEATTTTTKSPTTTTTTKSPTTTVATKTERHRKMDPCDLREVNSILIMDGRLYIAHEQHVWSFDLNGKTYDRPLSLRDYMSFLPDNLTHLSAAYQRPSGELMLFADNMIYMVNFPNYELVQNWPKSLVKFGLPPGAEINAVLNTNRGRSFVIYNDRIVGEIDECAMMVTRHYPLHVIFPGIPHGITSAFRYIDGSLYFINKRQFYKFNDFTNTVTTAGKFDLQIVGVHCPRDGLMEQLRDILNRFVRLSAAHAADLEDD